MKWTALIFIGLFATLQTAEIPRPTESASFATAVLRMDRALASHGIARHLTIEEGGPHNEISWARRFPLAIRYLLVPTAVTP